MYLYHSNNYLIDSFYNNLKQIQQKNQEKTFNIENIKNDLENYLDENQEKYIVDDEYKCNDFSSEKIDITKSYNTKKLELSQDKVQDCNAKSLNEKLKKDKLDSCNMDNKLRYEEWVYKDESKMNGTEQYDGIFAYDNMIDKDYSFSDICNILKKNNFALKFKSKMYFRKTFEYIFENLN